MMRSWLAAASLLGGASKKMLGMLKVIFGADPVAGRLLQPGEMQVLPVLVKQAFAQGVGAEAPGPVHSSVHVCSGFEPAPGV